MLVTCPECQDQISEHADPCPHCGFPHAGERSKEHVEKRKLEHENRPKPYDSDLSECPKIGCQNFAKYVIPPKSYAVKTMYDGSTGFFLCATYRCNKCGTTWDAEVGGGLPHIINRDW